MIAAARIDADVRAAAAEQAQKMVNDLAHISDSQVHKKARKAFPVIRPFHFPVAFPEVFLRDRAGFDVIIGNPPWEEATVEEQGFWVRHFPGLRGMPAAQKETAKRHYRRERPDLVTVYESELLEAESIRRVLVSGPFPGMRTGDPDVYKAFAWRFWNLICEKGGRLGVVLPRSVFSAKGSEEFRRRVLSEGSFADLTFLLNSAGWVFDDAEYRYTIALCGLARAIPGSGDTVPLRGPFASMSRYLLGMKRDPARFAVNEALTWTDSAALPLLPSDESADAFLRLRKSPRLDATTGDWTVRPYAELHATNDKKLMRFAVQKPDNDFWPVFKGESFDIWEPDTGTYYSWAKPEKLIPILQDKRIRSAKLARSPFQGFPPPFLRDPKTLACNSVRVAFRDVTNRTKRRTMIAALIPPRVFVANTAPYLLWSKGDERDQAFLLGVCCSIPLDWYARRFVELHMNYHIFGTLPLPRPDRGDPRWVKTVKIAGRLACPDKRFKKWAEAVDVDYGPIDADRKEDMIHELDAVVAHLYRLSEAQLTHIYSTFQEGWDYISHLNATLAHYRNWTSKQ